MTRWVGAFAPGSVSNVGCAFDVLGFAVEGVGDEVQVRVKDSPGVEIVSVSGDCGRLPRDARSNTAGVAARAMLEALGEERGAEIRVEKKMPSGSGLGSSAASAAGAAVALNEALGRPFPKADLLPFVVAAEEAAVGERHADNAAPCLLGGIRLVRGYDPLDVVALPVPEELFCALALPELEIETGAARKLLARQVSLRKAARQWGNVAGLIAGLCTGDYELIGRSLEDVIIEPQRSKLVPGFDRVKAAATEAGGLGCSLSGSGPALFALCKGAETAGEAALAMERAFREQGTPARSLHSPIRRQGAAIR